MDRPTAPRSRLQRAARQRSHLQLLQLVADLVALREDAGLSQRTVAATAGIDHTTLGAIEAGRVTPALGTLSLIGAALGASVSLRLAPGTGPLVRDHLQAAMLQALLRVLDRRWVRDLEVAVYQPVRGVIDAVLEDPLAGILVTTEVQSELRRIEQQVRWSRSKADALALARARAPGTARHPDAPTEASRLLLLRSTRSTRAVVHEYADLLAAAYPARHGDLVASLTGPAPWPGSGIVWCAVADSQARLLERPPHGIMLGR